MKEWDYGTHKYKEYKVPEGWDCPILAGMDEEINCVRCGKKVRFGEMYSSSEIQNDYGLGYNVCEECHEKEYERAKEDNVW